MLCIGLEPATLATSCARSRLRASRPVPVHVYAYITRELSMTTVPERVVSVGKKNRERCRVPKVQAALCPATMPYRRLIDDARRP